MTFKARSLIGWAIRQRQRVVVILKPQLSDETPRIPIKIHTKVPDMHKPEMHKTPIQQSTANSNATGIPLVVEVCKN